MNKERKHEKPHIVKVHGWWHIFRNRRDSAVWPWSEASGDSVHDACDNYRRRGLWDYRPDQHKVDRSGAGAVREPGSEARSGVGPAW